MSPTGVGSSVPTIFIVDDDPSVREALELLVRTRGWRASSHATAQEFLDGHDDRLPGCLLLDMKMPGMNGRELQSLLLKKQVLRPIIFVTAHADVSAAVAAMRAGAVDFVQKPFEAQDLLERIERALAKDAADRALLHKRAVIRRRFASLTPREAQVMQLIVEGRANKVIAADLSLSQRTVEIHRARVMEKMQAASLAHLVRMVIEVDLL